MRDPYKPSPKWIALAILVGLVLGSQTRPVALNMWDAHRAGRLWR